MVQFRGSQSICVLHLWNPELISPSPSPSSEFFAVRVPPLIFTRRVTLNTSAMAFSSLPPHVRITPWKTWHEWAHVYALLYAQTSRERNEGAAVVAMWRARGRLPVAADGTAWLVEALAAGEAAPPQAAAHHRVVRSAIALSIARLVSAVADARQTRRFASSVRELVTGDAQGAMPPLLVDIRHAVHHDVLPSLDLLRTAASVALQWCDERYWAPQLARVRRAQETVEKSVAELLSTSERKLANAPAGRAARAALDLGVNRYDAPPPSIVQALRLKADIAAGEAQFAAECLSAALARAGCNGCTAEAILRAASGNNGTPPPPVSTGNVAAWTRVDEWVPRPLGL